MFETINKSNFKITAVPAVDHNDNHCLVVAIKATFTIDSKNKNVNSDVDQIDIFMEDEYWGEPGKSSIKYEADTALRKLGTDIVLVGHAYNLRNTQYVDVGLRAGSLRKVVRVYGDRLWERHGVSYRMTSPKPFEKLPLIYENAFGGTDPKAKEKSMPGYEARNPVGKGYLAKKTDSTAEGIAVPNIEDYRNAISSWKDKPQPAGFGFVSKNWQPRVQYAGTYDEAWIKKRSPLLPKDFNEQFYSGASSELIARTYFSGGEPIQYVNACEQGEVNFVLPKYIPELSISIDNQKSVLETNLDTVVIEPDEQRLMMTWRAVQPCHWNLAKVDWIKLEQENVQ